MLRQYPYHLDANRILVEILPGTSLAGSIEQYKSAFNLLDPYAAYVSGSLFEADNVRRTTPCKSNAWITTP